MSVLEGLKKENIEMVWKWTAEAVQLLLCYNSFLKFANKVATTQGKQGWGGGIEFT